MLHKESEASRWAGLALATKSSADGSSSSSRLRRLGLPLLVDCAFEERSLALYY